MIDYHRELGDLNAGEVQLTLPASTYEMLLCIDCMRELKQFIGKRPPASLTGTIRGADKLYHLPWVDE